MIVIDFIDMDENKNNRAVERKMKEALTQDRARIQTSRISQFGLMEISRQRRRRSLLEGSTTSCPHCEGVGRKRTIESSALAAIRAVEETAARGEADRIRLNVSRRKRPKKQQTRKTSLMRQRQSSQSNKKVKALASAATDADVAVVVDAVKAVMRIKTTRRLKTILSHNPKPRHQKTTTLSKTMKPRRRVRNLVVGVDAAKHHHVMVVLIKAMTQVLRTHQTVLKKAKTKKKRLKPNLRVAAKRQASLNPKRSKQQKTKLPLKRLNPSVLLKAHAVRPLLVSL